MRLLGAPLLLLVAARLLQAVLVAVLEPDDLVQLAQGLLRDVHRVGPHVGDEADLALAGEVHALVQLLGDPHGLARGEPELAGGLLLEGGGGERRGRGPLDLLLANLQDAEGGVPQALDVLLGLLLGGEDVALLVGGGGQLLLPDLDQPGQEWALLRLRREPGVDAPVLLGLERLDLPFAVDDQPQRHRLDAAGRQCAAELLGKERRQLVSDDPVQDSAGLLGVHQVEVDAARVTEGSLHGVLGDLGEGHAVGCAWVGADRLGHVPGDGLALPVEVGGQPQTRGRLVGLAKAANHLLLVGSHFVFRLELVIELDPHAILGQVADVPLAGRD